MAVLLKEKAIFLHIPKTGGSWVTKCLDDQRLIETLHIGSKHADLERVNNFWRHYPYLYVRKIMRNGINLQSKINSSFKFCFVRHPYSWIKSYYRYHKERDWPHWNGLGKQWLKYGNTNWHPNEPLYNLNHNTFNDFLRDIVKNKPGYVHEMYSWYTGDKVDFVGKQENLTEDLICVLKKCNIPFDPELIRSAERVNVSKKKELKADADLVREFHRLEYPTLVKYGYEVPEYLT